MTVNCLSHCICLFTISPLASESNRQTAAIEPAAESRGMKDAHHENQCLKQCHCICARDCTWSCLVSISAQAISHSRQETLTDHCMLFSSDRNKSPHRLLFRCRRRECFRRRTCLQKRYAQAPRSKLQPCGELRLCIHSAGCHSDAAYFSTSLFSELAPLGEKHLSN